jgi:hypothetical protein
MNPIFFDLILKFLICICTFSKSSVKIVLVKITIVQTIYTMYNCLEIEGMDGQRKDCEIMNKKEELIKRIENLTPKQFELLVTLFAQQEQESVQVSQSDHLSLLQPCG